MTKDEAAARAYVDRIQEINARHGMGGRVSAERYEQIVHDTVRVVAPIIDRTSRD